MAPHALGGKPRSLDVVEEIDFEGEEQKLPRDAKSAIKDTNMVDSSTVSIYSVPSLYCPFGQLNVVLREK